VKNLLIIVLILGVLAVAACGSTPVPAPTQALPTSAPPATQPAAPTAAPAVETPTVTTSESPLGLPNPASQFCEQQGYKLEIRDEAGGQVGYCIFPNGASCEEWAFYRGECTIPETYP
jgi:putative hemolysin